MRATVPVQGHSTRCGRYGEQGSLDYLKTMVARTNCEVARNCRVVHPRKGKLVSLSGDVPILPLGIDEESGLTGIEGFKPFSANGQESVLAS